LSHCESNHLSIDAAWFKKLKLKSKNKNILLITGICLNYIFNSYLTENTQVAIAKQCLSQKQYVKKPRSTQFYFVLLIPLEA